ncbi:MAG: NAD-dependent epimerase/dehydratase family protein [Clostridia bacterium]|nr:NAD-dependent epimerase/dehydratase family protein [Clostridia bacterium]
MNIHHPLLAEEFAKIAALNLPYDDLAGKSVAVTGATGLVGSYLLRALDAIDRAHGLKLHLIALCRKPEAAKERLSGMENLSILPYDACAPLNADFRADYVVHAASNAHPLAFSTDPVGTMQANLLGTMQLLERVRATGGRLLFLSTGEIYGENPELASFDEHSFGSIDPMRFRACYPESKRAAETLCASYAQQYGVDALAARLTYTYGPTITRESSRADAQFLRCALEGRDIVLKSPGAQIRSYCYAADTASALLTLMLKGETVEAYNVANPDCNPSIREYAQTLADLAGVKLVFDLPPESERIGYSAVTRAVLDPGKLMNLGWRAAYDLRTGLSRTLAISR